MRWFLITIIIIGILGLVGTVIYFSGGTMKQQLINLNPFKLNGVMAQAQVNQTNLSKTYNPMRIQTDSISWKKIKHSGVELQYFNTTITTLSNTKAKICLYPKTSIAVNNPIIQNSKAYLFNNNVQTGLVQPSDMEVEKQQGNVKKMCLDVDGSLIDKVRFGNSSIVYEYQNDSRIIYSIFNFTTNFTLTKYNGESYVIAPQDIWIKNQSECKRLKNESSICFGAVDSGLNETELHNYKYLIESTDNIKIENQTVYNYQSLSKNRTRKEVYNFKDICKREFSNCSFNIINNKTVEVYFTSNKNIDPTVTITYPDINQIGLLYMQGTGPSCRGYMDGPGYYFDAMIFDDFCQGSVGGQYYPILEFNITNYSNQHAGDNILSVKLNLTINSAPSSGNMYIYNSSLQPSQTDWYTYTDALFSPGTLYTTANIPTTGIYSIDLGSTAITEFENQMSNGWFALVILGDTQNIIDIDMTTISLDVEYESANCWTFTNNRYEIPPSCKITISPTGVMS